MILAIAAGQANADDKAEPRKPQISPAPSDGHQGSSSPSYWNGNYWDAQDGKNFWQRLKPNSKRSQQAKSDEQPRKPAVNGSLRIRNENRARRR